LTCRRHRARARSTRQAIRSGERADSDIVEEGDPGILPTYDPHAVLFVNVYTPHG
jgi:hypothetical protein